MKGIPIVREEIQGRVVVPFFQESHPTSVEDFRPLVGLAQLKQNEGHVVVCKALLDQEVASPIELWKPRYLVDHFHHYVTRSNV